jgi:hypothetical protein
MIKLALIMRRLILPFLVVALLLGSCEQNGDDSTTPVDQAPPPSEGGDNTGADPDDLFNGETTGGTFDSPVGSGTEDVDVRQLPLAIRNADSSFSFGPVYAWGDASATFFLTEVTYNGSTPVFFVSLEDVTILDGSGNTLETAFASYAFGRSFQSITTYGSGVLLPGDTAVIIHISLDYGYMTPAELQASLGYSIVTAEFVAPTSRFELVGYTLEGAPSTEIQYGFENSGSETMLIDGFHLAVLYDESARPIDWTFLDTASLMVSPGTVSYLYDDGYYVSWAADDLAYGVRLFPEYADYYLFEGAEVTASGSPSASRVLFSTRANYYELERAYREDSNYPGSSLSQ